MTPREIFEQKIPGNITPEKAEKIGGTFQFKITGDDGGEWYIDLTKASDWVAEGTIDDPRCTITISSTDWIAIIDGSLNAQMAFMSGKLKVAGDMALSLKLQSLLG